MGAFTPVRLVRATARNFTYAEIVAEWSIAFDRGDWSRVFFCLDVMDMHARMIGGHGDLIEQSMNGWEVDVGGVVQG